MPNKPEITIIGAGLVGSLLSIQMAKLGHSVQTFEKRPDLRAESLDGGRSINLVLTSRGINALRELGLEDEIFKYTVPVTGRMIHDLEGNTTYQAYGRDKSECNYSVSRAKLNMVLLDIAQRHGVDLHFEQELLKADFENSSLEFTNSKIKTDIIFGTDGGGSQTRKELMTFLESKNIEHTNTGEALGASYKELLMPASDNGDYPLERNALHIWPRGSHMLMALPNLNGSFTMTLYLPDDGDICFNNLESDTEVSDFFNKYYKNALDLIPSLLKQWKENPTGKLATLRCSNWIYEDKVALLGDAAHAIVPFFGQGMNSGFEDCTYFNNFYHKHSGDYKKIFKCFEEVQKPNSTAIADMAIENFIEMKDKVGDPTFLLRKSIEHKLEETFPELYRARYGMVTYTLIPYDLTFKAGIIQNEIIDTLIKNMINIQDLDLSLAKELIDTKFTPFITKHKIDLKRFS